MYKERLKSETQAIDGKPYIQCVNDKQTETKQRGVALFKVINYIVTDNKISTHTINLVLLLMEIVNMFIV